MREKSKDLDVTILIRRKGAGRRMLKRIDKQPSPKQCPFCGSEARIRDLYDVVDWTNDDEPITKRRFVCECSGVDCWVSPVTDPFDTEEEAIEAWNRRSEV